MLEDPFLENARVAAPPPRLGDATRRLQALTQHGTWVPGEELPAPWLRFHLLQIKKAFITLSFLQSVAGTTTTPPPVLRSLWKLHYSLSTGEEGFTESTKSF